MIKYQKRAIERAAITDELIAPAEDLRAAKQRGAAGSNDGEIALYDALGANDSVVQGLGTSR